MRPEVPNISGWWLLTIVCASYLVIQLLYYKWVLTDDILENHFHSLGSEAVISDMIDLQKSRRWIYYLLHQFLVLLKVGLISMSLYLGAFFMSRTLSYWLFLKLTLLAETAVVIFELIKLNLILLEGPTSLQDILKFSPYSLAQEGIIGSNKLWLWHLLGNLNVFELIYLWFLSFLVGYYTDIRLKGTLKLTGLSYLCCLSLWLTLSSLFLYYAEISP